MVTPRGAAAGVLADWTFGEPPVDPHPVALFGQVMRGVERRLYGDSVTRGTLHALTGVALGIGAGMAMPAVAATYLAVAGRGLWDAASSVAEPLLEDDLMTARNRLPALVGRDPSALDTKEISRAVVESVAENTVDAIVAPALWGAAAGGPGALGYRAVNTLDAMVGHRSPRYSRYGTASARLDDLANWVPARVACALVVAAVPRRAAAVWAVRGPARQHPSPNAGLIEGAFAAALGLRLGGTNRYGERSELRPFLGDGRPAEPSDIRRAVALSQRVSALLIACLFGAGGLA
jgi:adenosylcobinamide-phosphate synthase